VNAWWHKIILSKGAGARSFGDDADATAKRVGAARLLDLAAFRVWSSGCTNLDARHLKKFLNIRIGNLAGGTFKAFATAIIASNEGRFSPLSTWPRYFGFNPAASAASSCVILDAFLTARTLFPKSFDWFMRSLGHEVSQSTRYGTPALSW
jgi:hypothetical protein